MTDDELSAAVRRIMRETEARIYRRVAAAIRDGHRPGWRGMGGPQDGDDAPPSFSENDVAADLEAAAAKVESD